MADKVYVKGSAKLRTFGNGGSVINLSLHAEDLIALAKEHANAKGYLNLTVAERQTPGKYGDTHSVYLDTFTPKAAMQEPGW
jgi:hypothetical protein